MQVEPEVTKKRKIISSDTIVAPSSVEQSPSVPKASLPVGFFDDAVTDLTMRGTFHPYSIVLKT